MVGEDLDVACAYYIYEHITLIFVTFILPGTIVIYSTYCMYGMVCA